ncbi:MAG: Xaa-Pro peptidase family protein [Pirellulaceae bacterium]
MPARIQRLKHLLDELAIESLLVTDETNVRYLSGFTGDSSYLLISGDRTAILSDRRYETQIAAQCGDLQAFVRGPDRNMNQLVTEAVESFSVAEVGFEASSVSCSLFEGFRQHLPNVDWKPTEGLVQKLRQIKEPEEVDAIRRAIHIAQRSYQAIRATLRIGQTELQIAYELESWIREFGGQGCGFPTIIAIDANAALPHAQPGTVKIDADSTVLIDWGAKYDGYTSDMTRMIAIGTIQPKLAEIYPIVLEAQLAAIDAIRPGVQLAAVDEAARSVIRNAGYGDQFGHGLGHGIGLQVHESPRMSAIMEGELEAGMIVTVEPGIYLPGNLGVRIEDDVLVTSQGREVLSSSPKGLDDCTVML